MSVPTESSPVPAEPVPDGLLVAGVYPTLAEGFDHGLVVLASGRPYWLLPAAEGCRLLIEQTDSAEVLRQLACFDRESVGWPPPPPEAATPKHRLDLVSPLLWSLTVLAVYWAEALQPRIVAAGELDASAVFVEHQWWRAATALFLHADAGHLLSNALTGVLVFAAVATTFGRLRGWLLVAISAVAGNFAAAALNLPGPYHSIGASTAIFAALGLLTGRAAGVIARTRGRRWSTMFTPIAAGLTVLALYGAGGVHVDVLAHATGFAAGAIAGLIVAFAP